MVERAILPDLQRRAGDAADHPQPHAAHLGRERVGPGRAAGRPHRASSTRPGNPTLAFLASGIEGIKVRLTAKGADEADGRRAARRRGGARSAPSSATSCSASTTRRWRPSCSSCCGARGPRPWRLAESVTGGLIGVAAHRRARRERRVPRLDRVLRQRGEVRRARRARGPGRVARGGRWPWPSGARRRARRRRRPGASPAWPARPSRRASRSAPCSSASTSGPLSGEAGPEAFHVPLSGDRLQIRQFTVITAMNALRLKLLGSATTPTPSAARAR